MNNIFQVVDEIVDELTNVYVHYEFDLDGVVNKLHSFARVHYELVETNKTLVRAKAALQTRYVDPIRSTHDRKKKQGLGHATTGL